MWNLIFVVVLGVAAFAGAGVPPILHSGKVFDARTGEPVVGVEVVGFFDEWLDNTPKYAVSKSHSDSLGGYHIGLNRPGTVHFIKAGYDSLVLHWPEEFEGSDRSGCGTHLTPVYLIRTSR
jgi:hypothetical protein